MEITQDILMNAVGRRVKDRKLRLDKGYLRYEDLLVRIKTSKMTIK